MRNMKWSLLRLPSAYSNKSYVKRLHASLASQCLLLLCLMINVSHLSAEKLNNYRLAADDIISVTVFDEPDLSLNKTRVATNGTISMPLIGQINVTGLTAEEVEAAASVLLLDGYLKQPKVTVSIIEYRLFYITGEVKKPGGYSFREGLTVHKAVSLAGGFSERANQEKISITHDGSTKIVNQVKLTDRIRPGDVITIKESFF